MMCRRTLVCCTMQGMQSGVLAMHCIIAEPVAVVCSQACFVDFGMAAQYGGQCVLRFDDTNPEAEKQEFIDHIQDIVSWLGWKPAQVLSLPSILDYHQ
jgi:hypothetical protein